MSRMKWFGRSLLHLIPDGILLPALCGLAGLVVGSLVGGRIFSSIDTKKMKEPSFLMVLTGTSPYAYQREDGVYVVPITALKN